MRVRENYEMETLEMLIDLNNLMYYTEYKIKNEETVESILGHDAWKLSDGIDALLKAKAESK